MTQLSSFGDLVKRYREAAGWTQEELAHRAGLSVRGIRYLERGERQPHPDTVQRLTTALALTPPRSVVLDTAARAALRDQRRIAHNLPLQLTSFIGRERDVTAVRRLLAASPDQHRLVTLTGAGGCGKTRLALEVARGLLPSYADGVWLVELAALTEPALLPSALVAALGLTEEQGSSPLETLRDFLAPRAPLLVVDNCEHLVAACAELATGLLAACPALQVLATSREPLGVAGEVVWRVPSLSVPKPVPGAAHPPALPELERYEAVQLFLERARASLPGFAPAEADLTHLVRICRQLDGLPLAIELAATRLDTLTLASLAARLDGTLQLLTGSNRAAPARQHTLRATLDWSCALLGDEERALLFRLSVFVGDWTLEAARAIHGSDAGEDEVLDLLTRLIRKSLVQADTRTGETRYQLLEVTRQYAHERLEAAGGLAETRRHHGRWYLALAEQAAPELRGPEQVAWLGRLEAEHDNLRVALAWSLAGGDGDGSAAADTDAAAATATDPAGESIALRLATALAGFWWAHGHMREGRRWLARALDAAHDAAPTLRARALLGAGVLSHRQGDVNQAAILFAEGLALARPAQDLPVTVELLNNLGWSLQFQGQYRRAVALHEESLALCRDLKDQSSSVRSQLYLGYALVQLGDYARGEQSLREAQVLADEIGDTWGEGAATQMLGLSAAAQGHDPLADALLHEALGVARRIGEKWGLAVTLCPLGEMACRQGRLEEAATYCLESLALFREMGEQWGIALALEGLAATRVAASDAVEGVRLLGVAARVRQAIGVEQRLPGSLNKWAIATARATLGDDGLAQALAEGRVTPLRRALDALLGQIG